VFAGDETGNAQLFCPLPVNAFTVSDGSQDNDMTWYRIFYRDSDGSGSAAQLTVRLGYRDSSGHHWAGSEWVSSDASAETSNTTEFQSNPHDVSPWGLYSFVVMLTRTNANQDPAFGGLDFAVPSIP
jgi:hypothetical protein